MESTLVLLLGPLLLGYLLGSIPFGLLLTRAAGLGDIRNVGSGNIGATNVLRTGRKGLAAATLLLDALKGVVAVLIVVHISQIAAVGAAAGAVLGHMFPVWLRFKGGKGVAVAGGAVIALMPLVALICFAIWIAVVAATRYTSLAAILACLAATPLAWALGYPLSTIVFAAVGTAAVLFLHRGNIRRLLRGEEHRIELGRTRRPPAGISGAP